MDRQYLILGSIILLLSVICGAFGAHWIGSHLGDRAATTFNTGVRYQFYHGFAILITAIIIQNHDSKYLRYAVGAFTVGIILFSGSLYLLAFKGSLGSLVKIIGPITPIGGLFFIIGWLFLIMGIVKSK